MAEPARFLVLPDALDGHAWPVQGKWTYEDYRRLPDDGNRYEVIRGSLYVTAAPTPLHQYALSRLHVLMGGFIAEQELGILLGAPLDVRLPQELGDPVQPDLLFLRTGNEPSWEADRSFDGVPDLVVEVLSRSTAHRDRKVKQEAYRNAGIRESWIVDPWARTILIYILRDDRHQYIELCRGNEEDTVRSVVLPGLEIRVGNLFPPRGASSQDRFDR
jgi:Uma2 family endonuclease